MKRLGIPKADYIPPTPPPPPKKKIPAFSQAFRSLKTTFGTPKICIMYMYFKTTCRIIKLHFENRRVHSKNTFIYAKSTYLYIICWYRNRPPPPLFMFSRKLSSVILF